MARILNITHVDLDGYMCGEIVKRGHVNDYVFTYYVQPMEVKEALLRNIPSAWDKIYITDLSYSKDCDEYIKTLDTDIFSIDHHVSSKNLETISIFNNLFSGTQLVYNYFFPNNELHIEELINAVTAYDLYMKESSIYQTGDFLNCLYYISKYLFTSYVNEYITRKSEGSNIPVDFVPRYEYVPSMVSEKKEADNKYIKAKIENSVPFQYEFNGKLYNAATCLAEKLQTQIGANYLNKNPDCDFFFAITDYSISVIANKNKDVSAAEIAIAHGGGGHVGAAGFPVNPETRKNFILKYCEGALDRLLK